ncbi:hypothetical protein AAFC00_002096 [Neodothiora populina]|uniref:Mitochondrial dicarboxylate carrier n=1 Tax=Neodothiora populina TaxID=2781224 RepID=A0ABR3PGC2_9PEZI
MTSAAAKVQEKSKDVHKVPIKYPLWFGGSSSALAALVSHPLDLVKVRLQTQHMTGSSHNMFGMFVHIYKDHGIGGLYKGISASLLRQITYSTTRFAVYEKLKQMDQAKNEKTSFGKLVFISSISGFAGSIVGNPADIMNVRMQHDAALPPAERRNYPNALAGIVRMIREEGWSKSLFRGVWPNSGRAVLMTASQLAGYDIFKQELLARTSMTDNTATHLAASLLAGFVATTLCSPLDVIKTRIMSAKEHTSIVHLLSTITKNEGPGWMFKGWLPSFIRLGPHTIATFVFLEQHKKLYRKFKDLDDK